MRIFSVSPNYNQANNVAFGKFADENAREKVRKALTKDINDEVMQPVYDSWFERIEKCDFFEAYTDNEDNIVKGRFTDEFVKSNADNKQITRRIDFLKRNKILDDLSKFYNAKVVASDIRNLVAILNGVDLSERWRSKNPRGDARPVEWEKEERIRNLAD